MVGTAERQYRKITSLKDGLRQEKETSRLNARQLKKIRTFIQKQGEKLEYDRKKWEMNLKIYKLAKEEKLHSYISETWIDNQNGYLNGKEELLKELLSLLEEAEK